jgi:hypothetical protein
MQVPFSQRCRRREPSFPFAKSSRRVCESRTSFCFSRRTTGVSGGGSSSSSGIASGAEEARDNGVITGGGGENMPVRGVAAGELVAEMAIAELELLLGGAVRWDGSCWLAAGGWVVTWGSGKPLVVIAAGYRTSSGDRDLGRAQSTNQRRHAKERVVSGDS